MGGTSQVLSFASLLVSVLCLYLLRRLEVGIGND